MTNDLTKDIEEQLQKYSRDSYPKRLSNKEWTKAMKEIIGDIGITKGFKVCASGKFESEWLYDLTWYSNNTDNSLKDIPLVMECEWSRDVSALKFDFQKLVQARARIRIMIFQGFEDEINKTLQMIKDEIDSFELSQKGDLYLIAALNMNKGEFQFKKIEN